MNRTQVNRLIAAAQADGSLGDLLYFVEMDLPAALRPSQSARTMAATWPAGWIPCVPLAPDPAIAADWSHLLLELIKSANVGRGIVFRVELTSRPIMSDLGLSWYVWGESIPALVDAVCPVCGAVGRVPVGERLACCPPPSPLGAGAGMYAGQWWGGL